MSEPGAGSDGNSVPAEENSAGTSWKKSVKPCWVPVKSRPGTFATSLSGGNRPNWVGTLAGPRDQP